MATLVSWPAATTRTGTLASNCRTMLLCRKAYIGLTPVSRRDESLGSGSVALRHVILRFLAFFGSAPAEPFFRPDPRTDAAAARSGGQGRPLPAAARRACP